MAPPNTAILLVDPYNDFLHEDGKLYNRLAESIKVSGTIQHLHEVVKAARQHKIPIFYGLHQQTHAHSFEGWLHVNKSHKGLAEKKVFEEGSWGAQFFKGLEPDPENGDVVVSKHWNSSSFQNTDLHYQLGQRGIRHVIMVGLVANTCLESTARYAYENGYAVTMLCVPGEELSSAVLTLTRTDATAGFTSAAKDAATSLIWPLFADRVLTTNEWAESLGASASGSSL